MTKEDPPTTWESNQPTTWQWVLMAGIAVVMMCGIAAFIFFTVQTYNRWARGRNQMATQAAVTATAAAVERTRVLREASRWPILILDRFTENVNDWMEGEIEDEYTTMSLTIDGRYVWDATAKQGFVWRIWPRSDEVGDFYLAVDAHNFGDNLDAQYGLIFRNHDGSYYYFEVRDTQHFRVFSFADFEWVELISSTFTEAIRPGGKNHLEVAVWEDVFYFLINGQFVGQTQGSYPPEGQVGLMIGLTGEGEKATIAFDNFELRAPGTSK